MASRGIVARSPAAQGPGHLAVRVDRRQNHDGPTLPSYLE